jgi:hypothetical protein
LGIVPTQRSLALQQIMTSGEGPPHGVAQHVWLLPLPMHVWFAPQQPAGPHGLAQG